MASAFMVSIQSRFVGGATWSGRAGQKVVAFFNGRGYRIKVTEGFARCQISGCPFAFSCCRAEPGNETTQRRSTPLVRRPLDAPPTLLPGFVPPRLAWLKPPTGRPAAG